MKLEETIANILDEGGATGPSSYKLGVVWITQGFPKYDDGTSHNGLDLACSAKCSVIAVEGGEVIEVRRKSKYSDMVIILGEDSGHRLIYKHTGSSLKKGDLVKKGQIIGKPNLTGRCNGYHLHFQVELYDNEPIDPVGYFMEYHPDLKFWLSKNYPYLQKFYRKQPYWEEFKEMLLDKEPV